MSSTFRLIRTLLFSTMVTLVAASVAHAQKPVLTKNIDEPGRTPYFSQSGVGSNCGGSCDFAFTAVPAGYRLVVTYASVSYHNEYAGGGSIRLRMGYISNNGSTYKAQLPVATPLDMMPGNSDFELSVPFTAYVEPTGMPIIRISGNMVNLNAEATLTGYLVSLE